MRLIEKVMDIFGTIIHRWRWWHVPVVLVTVFLLSYGLLWWTQTSALEKRYAEMRAAGHPATLEELNDYYAIPEGVEDTTKLWLEALRLVTDSSSNVDMENLPIVGYGPDIPPVGQPWAEKEIAVAYLNEQANVLTAIHHAADAGGGVRFPHDLSQGALHIDESMALRDCIGLLALEAHVRSHDGDVAGAADSIRTMFATGRTLDHSPNGISFLIRSALDGVAEMRTRQLMTQIEFTSDDLQAIQSDLRRVDYVEGLYRALVGDRVHDTIYYDDLTSVGFTPVEAYLCRVAVPGAKVRHFDLMGDAIAATSRPWHEALLTGSNVANWQPQRVNPFDFMVSQVIVSMDIFFLVGARTTAFTSSLDTAIAVELFRRDRERLPTTLDDLVPRYLPEVPVDPFDGEPLRYVVEDHDFVVYSIGEDFVDNQGDVEDRQKGLSPDFGIRLNVVRPEAENK